MYSSVGVLCLGGGLVVLCTGNRVIYSGVGVVLCGGAM